MVNRNAKHTLGNRIGRAIRSLLDPAVIVHPFRIIHYYGYSHVAQKRKIKTGTGVRIAPNVSFANGERIVIGDGVQIGARCSLWAGNDFSHIFVGHGTTFGPECFVTAANYGTAADVPVTKQPMQEQDIRIGANCWIGARCIITAGVTIEDDVVVGAGSVVTKDLPRGSIAAGVPARVIRYRE